MQDEQFSEEFLFFRSVFEQVLQRDLPLIDGHTRILDDLGADSLALMEVLVICDEFDVKFDERQLMKAATLGDVLRLVVE